MKRIPVLGLVGMVLAALLLFVSGAHPVRAGTPEPGTASWDVILCVAPMDLNGGGDDVCVGDTYEDSGSVAGKIDVGDLPELVANIWIDPTMSDDGSATVGNEPNFDSATAVWGLGLQPAFGTNGMDNTPGTADDIQIGDITTRGTFGLHTNATKLGSKNIDLTTGQPPPCVVGSAAPPRVGTTLDLYQAAENLSGPTVSQLDLTGPGGVPDGLQDTANDINPANGIYDGADKMPLPLVAFVNGLGFPGTNGSLIARSFGVAVLISSLNSDADINFLMFDLRPLGKGWMSLILTGYLGVPTNPPTALNVTDQTVKTCAPYLASPVRMFGKTLANNNAVPATAGGKPSLKVVASGIWDFKEWISTDEDLDGDGLPGLYDGCPTVTSPIVGGVAIDDLRKVPYPYTIPPTGTGTNDGDGDGLTGACDSNGEGDGTGINQPLGTNPGPFTSNPATFSSGQDQDLDGFLNRSDNCPLVANGAGSAGGPQADGDNDGIGDLCDPAPTVFGDGTGYASGLNDMDNICNDQFVTDGTAANDPAGEAGNWGPVKKSCLADRTVKTAMDTDPIGTKTFLNPLYSNPKMAAVFGASPYRNSAAPEVADGEPDWLDGETSACPPGAAECAGSLFWYDYAATGRDSDGDKSSDACETYQGTDPLNANVEPATGLDMDCDGDGTSDAAEETANTNFLTGIDSDGDGWCNDIEEVAKGLNPAKWYDFYDVAIPVRPDPAPNGIRNGAINFQDVLGVLGYVGTQAGAGPNLNGVDYDSDKNLDGVPDGMDYDRGPGATPPAPSGAVNFQDVLALLGQVGKLCI